MTTKRSIITSILLIVGTAAILCAPLSYIGSIDSPSIETLDQNIELLKDTDIIVIGDSRCHVGISPDVLQNELAQKISAARALNLCVDGSDVTHHLNVLRSAIIKGMRPKIIIWAVNPLQFSNGLTNNRLEQLGVDDLLPMLRSGAPHELLLDILTGLAFRPWAHRSKLKLVKSDYMERAALRALPIQKQLGYVYINSPNSRKYTKYKNGYEPFSILEWENRYKQGLTNYKQDYSSLKIENWRLKHAGEIADLALDAGARLYVVELPVSKDYLALVNASEQHIRWRETLSAAMVAKSASYLNHSALYANKLKQFGDPGHMSDILADEYTTYLSNSIYLSLNGYEYESDNLGDL